jgi:hypothetical protein
MSKFGKHCCRHSQIENHITRCLPKQCSPVVCCKAAVVYCMKKLLVQGRKYWIVQLAKMAMLALLDHHQVRRTGLVSSYAMCPEGDS